MSKPNADLPPERNHAYDSDWDADLDGPYADEPDAPDEPTRHRRRSLWRPRDPYLRAIELIRAASNKDHKQFRKLWRRTIRRTATATALADVGDSFVRIVARLHEERPGEVLNATRDEMKRQNRRP